jgi:transcriptional regulator with XRE-family HTH domain
MLKQFLEARNMSANELAKRSGVPKSTVYNAVNGDVDGSKIRVEHAIKFSDILGVSVEELYGMPPIPEPISERKALTDDERELLDAWNHATDAARESALMVLKCNQAPVVKKGTAI